MATITKTPPTKPLTLLSHLYSVALKAWNLVNYQGLKDAQLLGVFDPGGLVAIRDHHLAQAGKIYLARNDAPVPVGHEAFYRP